jgi:hypothetical protein
LKTFGTADMKLGVKIAVLLYVEIGIREN